MAPLKLLLKVLVLIAMVFGVKAQTPTPPIRFTEIMYRPADSPAFQFLEFVNDAPEAVDASGFTLEGVEFVFPEGTTLAGNGVYVLISELNPPAFRTRFPGVNVLGTYKESLADATKVTLKDGAGRVVTTVGFGRTPFWPPANGTGLSLVSVGANREPNDAASWTRSVAVGGTPGTIETPIHSQVVLSEVHAYGGWIEIVNNSAMDMDISGWAVTDEPANLRKFVFQNDTTIAAGRRLVVGDFALPIGGGTVALYDFFGLRADAVTFGQQIPNYSLGRGDGGWSLANPTMWEPNQFPVVSVAVKINELVANAAPGGSDWIELHNTDLFNPASIVGMRLATLDESFTIRTPNFLSPGGYIQLFADELQGPRHLGLKLTAEGTRVALFGTNGEKIDEVSYGPQSEAVSLGLGENGLTMFFPYSETPGARNELTLPRAPTLSITKSGGEVTVSFAGEADRSYSLLAETTLNGGQRQRVQDFAATAAQTFSVTEGAGEARKFYVVATPRVRLMGDPDFVSVEPSGVDVLPNATVVVRTAGPIDPGTLTSDTFVVTDDLGRRVPGSGQFADNFQVIKWTPNAPFACDTLFTVRIDVLRYANAGEALAPMSATFRTRTAAALVEDRSVYAQDTLALLDTRLRVIPLPGGYTKADVDADIDNTDDLSATVDVNFREGTYGANVNGANATLEQRGASTRFSNQKSYKVRVTGNRWRGHRVINFNKHPYDLTRIRNKLSFDLFQAVPNFASLRTLFARMTIDNADHGVYTQIEEPNSRYLSQHGFDENGHFYKANFFEFLRYADRLKVKSDPTFDLETFETILEVKGAESHEKLVTMLDDVNDGGVPIDRVIEKHFNRENYLTWFAVNILVGNVDTASQNFFLYSPTTSRTWYFLPWDYDGAWGFYDQPDQVNFRLPRSKQGLANWWGVALHRRFLKEPGNLQALIDKMNTLLAVQFERTRVQAKVDQLAPRIRNYLMQPPDLWELPLVVGGAPALDQYNAEVARLAGVPAQNAAALQATLNRPMPIFLGVPELRAEGTFFVWEESYHLFGHALTYDLEISRTTSFETADLVYVARGLTGTSHTVAPALAAGDYFFRVIARDATNPAEDWQLPFDNYWDEAAGVARFGMRRFTIP